MPQFQCAYDDDLSTVFECSREDFCDKGQVASGISYTINWDSVYSLHNWIEPLNLACASDFEIGLFGSLYFVGFAVGAFSVVRLGDVYGRKWVLVTALGVQTILFLLFIAVQQ